ncbi:hypothetical protein BDR26DRAFT_870846 [Obelidium mucronatum]|nr:hypothetical protein BDR26DRAFT_870846 [Obelidium mucronatum]
MRIKKNNATRLNNANKDVPSAAHKSGRDADGAVADQGRICGQRGCARQRHKLPWDAAPARPASRTLLLRPRAATEAKPKLKSAPLGAPLARARSRSMAPHRRAAHRRAARTNENKNAGTRRNHTVSNSKQAQTQLLDQSFSELYAVRDVTDVDTAWLSSVTGDIGDSETSLDEEAEMKRNEARMAELCRQEELAFKNKLIPLDSLAPGSLIRENLLDQVAAKEAAASLKLNSSSASGSIETSCITLDFSAKD